VPAPGPRATIVSSARELGVAPAWGTPAECERSKAPTACSDGLPTSGGCCDYEMTPTKRRFIIQACS
jgi:hypothetical protein